MLVSPGASQAVCSSQLGSTFQTASSQALRVFRKLGLSRDGSQRPSQPLLVDEQFWRAWLPSVFNAEVGGWLPTLLAVDFPPLIWE